MNTKDKIIKAQATIIDNLIDCEEAISNLYALYAKSIPEMAGFWQELSDKERVHADLLRTMHRQLANGNIFQNIGRFDSSKTEEFLREVNEAAAYAKKSNLSRKEVIKTALRIESSVIDAHFYDIVSSDAAEYKIIADRLSSDTQEHVKSVRDKLVELHTDQS